MKRDFERQGMGYVMHLTDIATDLAIDRLTRSRGELHGELVVTSALPGTRSASGHLHQARFNLSGSETRTRVAKAIAARANTRDDIDWLDVLEDFCRRVLAAEREGSPPIRVGTLPKPLGVAWRLDPIIPIGKPVILYGEGGTGKSTLAAAFAVSVETGTTLIEGIIPRQATVLYLDWESDKDEINDRVRGVAMGANLPKPASILYRACHGPLHDQVEDLARLVDQHSVGLVVVDSVGLASGTGSDGGDAAETALRLFAAFRILQAAHEGCAVLAIDHVSKADADNGKGARPYGSIYKVNLARAMFELRAGPQGQATTSLGLYNTKSNVRRTVAPIALEVTHEEDGAVRYQRLSQMSADLKTETLADRIYDALEGERFTPDEIAKMLGEDNNKVRAVLSRKKAMFNRLTYGKWEVLPRAS